VRPRSNVSRRPAEGAAGEVDATDERLNSEGAVTEAAWPWALPADGG